MKFFREQLLGFCLEKYSRTVNIKILLQQVGYNSRVFFRHQKAFFLLIRKAC